MLLPVIILFLSISTDTTLLRFQPPLSFCYSLIIRTSSPALSSPYLPLFSPSQICTFFSYDSSSYFPKIPSHLILSLLLFCLFFSPPISSLLFFFHIYSKRVGDSRHSITAPIGPKHRPLRDKGDFYNNSCSSSLSYFLFSCPSLPSVVTSNNRYVMFVHLHVLTLARENVDVGLCVCTLH